MISKEVYEAQIEALRRKAKIKVENDERRKRYLNYSQVPTKPQKAQSQKCL